MTRPSPEEVIEKLVSDLYGERLTDATGQHMLQALAALDKAGYTLVGPLEDEETPPPAPYPPYTNPSDYQGKRRVSLRFGREVVDITQYTHPHFTSEAYKAAVQDHMDRILGRELVRRLRARGSSTAGA